MRASRWITAIALIALLGGCPQRDKNADSNASTAGGGGGDPPAQLGATPDAQTYHDRIARAAIATGGLQDALRVDQQPLAEQALATVRGDLDQAQTFAPPADAERLTGARELVARTQADLKNHAPAAVADARDLLTNLVGIQQAYAAPVRPTPRTQVPVRAVQTLRRSATNVEPQTSDLPPKSWPVHPAPAQDHPENLADATRKAAPTPQGQLSRTLATPPWTTPVALPGTTPVSGYPKRYGARN